MIGVLLVGATGWLHVDDDCDALPVRHDASAHRIEAADRTPEVHTPQHCYVCEWLRTLRQPASQRTVLRRSHARVLGVAEFAVRIASVIEDSQLPARAPPA
jgi:hypothetical protein